MRGLLIIPTNRMAAYIRLIPRDRFNSMEAREPDVEYAPQRGTPYGLARTWLLTPKKVPCSPPPFGMLAAIDTTTGEKKWESTLGALPGACRSGRETGIAVTRRTNCDGGGLVFIGGTFDPYLRAFDVETGKQLWKGKLPASARATPMTYRTAKGKQYVVIAAGGHDVPGSVQGDALVAFALP